MKMSRAQRREAFTIPIQLQYRTDDEPQNHAMVMAQQMHDRPGVVIGGGANAPPGRLARGGGQGLRHSRSEPQMVADALQASMHSSQAEAAMRDPSSAGQGHGDEDTTVTEVAFSRSDFPILQGGSPALGPMGRWAAYAGGWAGGVCNAGGWVGEMLS